MADELAARRAFKEHIGVGERQPTSKHSGSTKTYPVADELRHGRVAGYQHEHWDGRVSATVTPPALHVKMNMTTKEEG